MREDFLPSNPGPAPVTREVWRAMDAPMISHRSADFEAIYARAPGGQDDVFERSLPARAGGGIPHVRPPKRSWKRWSA